MNPIGSLIKLPPKPKLDRRSERGELLLEFLSHIRASWDEKRYGKMTIGRLARKLQGIPTKDLYYLKRVCEDSKDYSKRFFWELNPNKHQK